MSGICGVVELGGRPVPAGDLEAMLDAAAFRGPDRCGRWQGGLDAAESADGNVAMGHLALHVTPESVHERQPLADTESGLVLVADARLDNRDDLIRTLEPREDIVTDAALILAAYRRWGDDCAGRLLGDFAFAVWDGRRRRLFAARDAMGMRGFHYRLDGDRLIFGTEVQQILAVPGVPVEIFEPAVAAHLVAGHGAPDWTFYRGIAQLPAAHALEITPRASRTWRYWDVDPEHRIRPGDDRAYAEEFRSLFADAVRARLRTVKPVGLLLSGGVDSGSIAAMAGWLLAHEPGLAADLRAYSFAFDELTESDERHISAPLAGHFGIPVVDVPADDAWPLSTLPENPTHPDSPFVFGHYATLERAFRRAREDGVGLMMSGDRGDLIAGLGIWDLPALVRRARWATLFGELRTLAHWRGTSLGRQVRNELLRPARKAVLSPASPLARLPVLRRVAHPAAPAVPAWIPPDFARRTGLRELLAASRRDDAGPLNGLARRQRYGAIFAPLHMQGVLTSERMHARHGQGFADPWSDRRLAEFALAVPPRILNTVGQPKRLTRLAMKGVMPEASRQALSKILPTPLFRRGLWDRERDTVRRILSPPDCLAERRGYLDPGPLLDGGAATAGDMDADTGIWRAVTLELWLRRVGRP